MKRTAALWTMKTAAAAGTVRFSDHALDEARADSFEPKDVIHAMQHVSFAEEQKGGTFAVAAEWTWRCKGRTATGRTLGFVAALTDGVVVVTVYSAR